MNLPTSEPIDSNPEDLLSPARRRRQRRQVLPGQNDDHSRSLDELGRRVTPGAEFFLSALLGGVVLGAGMLLDAPALAVLAALLAPFMGPVLGLGLASSAGSVSFLLRTLVSLLAGGLIFFLTGTLAGWIAQLLPVAGVVQANLHFLQISLPDLVLLAVGTILTTYLLTRSGQQRPLVSSVAIGYAIFLPLGAAGFALTSGSALAWGNGLLVFAAHLAFAGLFSALTFAALGFGPRSGAGALILAIYLLICAAAMLPLTGFSLDLTGLPSLPPPATAQLPAAPTATRTTATRANATIAPAALQATASPSAAPAASLTPAPQEPTPSRTPTRTLVPSSTPTQTITAVPTPVWARIAAKDGDGAYIRAEPNYSSNVVKALLNGLLIQVLPDVTITEGATWVKVRTADGAEGWIIRALLATATPAPGW